METKLNIDAIPDGSLTLDKLDPSIVEKINNEIPNLEVDATMSETSTNPVQNKTIKSYVDNAIEDVEANQIEVEDVVSLPDSPMFPFFFLCSFRYQA